MKKLLLSFLMVFLALPALAQQTAEITMNGLTATLNDGTTVQFGNSTLSYTTKTYITSIACNDVLSLEPSIGSNTSNSPSYNKSGDLRLYPNNVLKFVVKEGYTISKVEFTMTQNTGSSPKYAVPTVTPGTWSDANGEYVWSSDTGVDGFTITANSTSGKQFSFTKFTITYDKAGNPDLLPADLSFGEKTAFTIALGEEFTEAPTLVNPHDLPVTYTSSNEEVAMVDDETGEVVLMDGIGTTTISAVFAGDNTYNAQTVRYTLTVEKQYKSIAEILTADNNSIVKISFPMTVAFVNGPNIFATDDNGDFIQIYNPNSYNANDMIPSGWSATYTLYKGVTPELINANLPQSTETKEFVPEAVNYKDLTVAEDINKVVLLKNVAFATATPSTQDNFSGTINGETVDLRNNYALASVEAGIYDVTVVVMAYSGNVSLYVTNYAAVPAPAVPELLINGKPVSGDINETDGRLSFGEVPEGIYIYYLVESSNTPSGDEAAKAPAKAAPDTMENDGKTYNLYTEPETLANGSYTISYFAYDDATGLKSDVKTFNVSNTVGIEGIAAEDGAAEWFNLQGARVAEPQQGIYVRVANGKAAKVVVE